MGTVIPTALKDFMDGSLLSAQFTIGSIIVASLTFFQRLVWDYIEGMEDQKERWPYRKGFQNYGSPLILLLGGGLLAFFSAVVEVFVLTFFDAATFLISVRLGLFLTTVILLSSFLLWFVGNNLGRMYFLKRIDDGKKKKEDEKKADKSESVEGGALSYCVKLSGGGGGCPTSVCG
jgi:hypothetical protein